MTNGEKYKTASERKIAYIRYCKDCSEGDYQNPTFVEDTSTEFINICGGCCRAEIH